MTITRVEIPADRKPVVTFTVTDDSGKPLKLTDLDGNPSISIASIQEDPTTKLTQFANYVIADIQGRPYTFEGATRQPVLAQAKQAIFDPLPTPVPAWPTPSPAYREAAPGTYVRTLTTALPEGFDRNATHRVAVVATREARKYAANPAYDFVPAGGDVKMMRQVVTTASCNQCHAPLQAHGGPRRDTKLCVTCHTSQTTDPETGNTVEFKQLVHKIHDGRNLPSVRAGEEYLIVGFNQRVFDFGEIGWPQNIRNCTTCHGAPPTGMKAEDYAKLAPQADNWKNAPSAAACGACHDAINFTTGKNKFGGRDHPGGPQPNDSQCKTCHQADSEQEFDASVVGAHVIPERSKQLKGINFKINAAMARPGQNATVDFSITDNSGAPVNPNTMDYFEITMAHPTTDYAHRTTIVVNQIVAAGQPPFVRAGTLTDQGGGNWRYTFSGSVDSTWTGSVAFGMGGYRNATIKGNEGKDVAVREGNVNPVTYVSTDPSIAVTARRSVVDRNSCNSCHKDLGNPAGISIHGGIRRSTEYCILCHNANQSDEAYRKDGTVPESVQYKYLIHSLHAGEERAVQTEFRGRGIAQTSEVFFPGNLQNCATCHKPGTFTLPLPAKVLPTTVKQGDKVISVTQPITAACSGCHIGRPGFDAHTETMTGPAKGEACTTCHAQGRDFAVEKVHRP